MLIKIRKMWRPVLSVPYIRPYFSGTLVCTVHMIYVLASHIQLHYRLHSPESPNSASVPVADIVAAFQVQLFLVLAHIIAETFGRNCLSGIFIAPQFIQGIQFLGCDLSVCLESELSFRFKETGNVVAVGNGFLQIRFCCIADGEFIIVPDQSFQAFQTPEENAFCLCFQLFC